MNYDVKINLRPDGNVKAYDMELSQLQTKEQAPLEMPTQTHEMTGI